MREQLKKNKVIQTLSQLQGAATEGRKVIEKSTAAIDAEKQTIAEKAAKRKSSVEE